MQFQILETIDQLNTIDAQSASKPQLLFKHSTRCGTSLFAKRALEKEMENSPDANVEIYYLDLLRYREISNTIAERYGVRHESPQLLVIQNGKCVYHASHSGVSLESAMESVRG